jgi:hypothetical protein
VGVPVVEACPIVRSLDLRCRRGGAGHPRGHWFEPQTWVSTPSPPSPCSATRNGARLCFGQRNRKSDALAGAIHCARETWTGTEWSVVTTGLSALGNAIGLRRRSLIVTVTGMGKLYFSGGLARRVGCETFVTKGLQMRLIIE